MCQMYVCDPWAFYRNLIGASINIRDLEPSLSHLLIISSLEALSSFIIVFGVLTGGDVWSSRGVREGGMRAVGRNPRVDPWYILGLRFGTRTCLVLSCLGTSPGFGRQEAGEGNTSPLSLLLMLEPSWGSGCLAGPLQPNPALCQGTLSQRGLRVAFQQLLLIKAPFNVVENCPC